MISKRKLKVYPWGHLLSTAEAPRRGASQRGALEFRSKYRLPLGFPGAQTAEDLPAMPEIRVRSLGLEDPLVGHGYPPHYSSLENPMDRGAWQAAAHGVAESDRAE